MTRRIATILKFAAYALFDIAERLHPIDTQPLSPIPAIPLQWTHSNDTFGADIAPLTLEWQQPA